MTSKATSTILPSAARVATASVDTNTSKDLGIQYVINVTVDPASASVVPTISGVDPVSGAVYTLLVGSAITGTGITVLQVHPEMAAVANLVGNAMLPQVTRLTMTHADGDSITYSVSAMMTD